MDYPNCTAAAQPLGSGPSFSSPRVAGAAARLRQADPTATNDRIKFALMGTAGALGPADGAGRGTIDVAAALAAPPGEANQGSFHPLLFPAGLPSLLDLVGLVPDGTSWQGTSWQGT